MSSALETKSGDVDAAIDVLSQNSYREHVTTFKLRKIVFTSFEYMHDSRVTKKCSRLGQKSCSYNYGSTNPTVFQTISYSNSSFLDINLNNGKWNQLWGKPPKSITHLGNGGFFITGTERDARFLKDSRSSLSSFVKTRKKISAALGASFSSPGEKFLIDGRQYFASSLPFLVVRSGILQAQGLEGYLGPLVFASREFKFLVSNFSNFDVWGQYFPSEVLSTDNIMAFLNMLPYRGRNGISKMLITTELSSSPFSSLSIRSTLLNVSIEPCTFSPADVCKIYHLQTNFRFSFVLTSESQLQTRLLNENVRRNNTSVAQTNTVTTSLVGICPDGETLPREPMDPEAIENNCGQWENISNSITIFRDIKDSRSNTVHVTLSITNSHPKFPARISVTEHLPAHLTGSESSAYDISLHSYKYAIRSIDSFHNCSNPDRTCIASTETSSKGHVLDIAEARIDASSALCVCEGNNDYCGGSSIGSGGGSSSSSSSSSSSRGRRSSKSNTYRNTSSSIKDCHYLIVDGTISWTIMVGFRQSITASFTARKSFLHRESIPSDASRGFILAPSYVTVSYILTKDRCTNESSNDCGRSFIVPGGLITQSIPDLSMPLNVIVIVLTLAAFLLGSMINALVRKSSKSLFLRGSNQVSSNFIQK